MFNGDKTDFVFECANILGACIHCQAGTINRFKVLPYVRLILIVVLHVYGIHQLQACCFSVNGYHKLTYHIFPASNPSQIFGHNLKRKFNICNITYLLYNLLEME